MPTSLLHRLLPGRLLHQISIIFALIFGASMLLYSLYTANTQREMTEAHLQAQAEALTKGLALSSQEALSTGEVWLLQPMLRQAAEFPGLLGIDLTDSAGILLASVARQGDDTVPGLQAGYALATPASTEADTHRLGVVDAHAPSVQIVVWIPIGENAQLGWVRARFSLEQADRIARQFYRDSLLSSLLVIALTSLAFFLYLRRPLLSLRAASTFAARLEHADGAQMPLDSGVRDIDELGHALNRASARLHQQQATLRQSETHFRTVVEGLSEVLFETDAALRFTYINPAWQAITQREIGSCLGQRVSHHFVEEERAALDELLEHASLGQAESQQERFRLRAIDGSLRWLELRARARRDDGGQVIGVLGSCRDVTHRVKAEEALTHQLQFVERLVDCIPNALYVRHSDGRFLAINTAFERLLGVQRGTVIGERRLASPADPTRHACEEALLQFEAGPACSAELSLRTAHGPIEVLCLKAALAGPEDTAAGVIVAVTDISKRRQAEEEMRRARDAAQAASQAKSDFLANISHEIRTPMNAILGMTQLTLDTPLNGEQHEYLSLVKHSAESLLTVLNDLLDFSKIEAGQLTYEALVFSLPDCLRGAVATLAPQASAKGLRMEVDVAPEMPAALVGDAGRLRQVLLNLLSNAIKFTSQGEIHVVADVLTHNREQTCVRIAINDTGIGIPPDQHATIFDAFVQADGSHSRKYGGTGLGLSIAARLVEGMGGRIWLESQLDRGSTFFFTAVLGTADAHALGTSAAADTKRRSATPLHLLLAEDNPVNQLLALRLLDKLGHTVEVVSNGNAAVAAARNGRYDAILMDVQMPEMSGLDATRAIRAEEAERGLTATPIIAMTAHAMAGDRDRCLAAGMNAYLTKPIVIDALIGELERITPAPIIGVDAAWQLSPTLPEPIGTTEASSPFDKAWMLEQIGGDEELMREVIRIFVEDYPRLLSNLRQGLATADCGAVQSAAHALKGAVSNFGAPAAVAAALALEQAARLGKHEQFSSLGEATERTADDLLAALREQLDASHPSPA